jgi:hypothetical protein
VRKPAIAVVNIRFMFVIVVTLLVH